MVVTYPIEVVDDCPFPLHNIPFGIFNDNKNQQKRVGTAIGEYVLDLSILESHGFFSSAFTKSNTTYFSQPALNFFADSPSNIRTSVRDSIISEISDPASTIYVDRSLNEKAWVHSSKTTMHIPFTIGDFTDFCASVTHSDNCARMSGFRTPPAFYAMPTAYNGRASSIIPSGTPIHRPRGIIKSTSDPTSFSFSPSQRMDYELEMGFFVSRPVPFGAIIESADDAREHIFGFVLLNDWSARDIQFSEMQPLGPFNGKGSGTSISLWVVTLDALDAALVSTSDALAAKSMKALPRHLRHEAENYTWDIRVKAKLERDGLYEVSKSNLRDLYWSPMQMLAHHASSGCGLRTGDLMGTGTLSSPPGDDGNTLGCLHELTEAGKIPLRLGDEKSTLFLEDNDDVIFEAWVGEGKKLGFGEVRGKLLPCI